MGYIWGSGIVVGAGIRISGGSSLSWVQGGRLTAVLTVSGADLASLPKVLATHGSGASSAQVSVDASKKIVVSIAGTAYTFPVALGFDSSSTLDISIEAGGGTVPSNVKVRLQGSNTTPLDVCGSSTPPTQAAVGIDSTGPTLGSGVALATSIPSWASTYLPTDLRGIIWESWSAEFGIGLATGVSSWAGISGNGKSFTQSTGPAQPTYVASDALFAGKPSLLFDGSNDVMSCTTNITTAAMSFAAVVYLVTAGTYPMVWINQEQSTELRFNSTTGTPALLAGTANLVWGSPALATRVVLTGGRDASGSWLAVNGGTRVTGVGSAASSAAASCIGARAILAANFSNQRLAHLDTFTALITPAQEATHVAHLLGRY